MGSDRPFRLIFVRGQADPDVFYQLSVGRADARPARLFEAVGGVDSVTSTPSRLFWSAHRGRRQAIYSAKYNGSGLRELVHSTGISTSYLAIAGRYLYWSGSRAIGRVGLDGTHADASFLSIPQAGGGDDVADGLASDGHYLYFDQCIRGRVGRVAIPQSTPSHVNIKWLANTSGCAQHLVYRSGYLYYTEGDPAADAGGFIGRLSTSGGDANEAWVSIHPPAGTPFDLTVIGTHIYWEWCRGGGCTDGWIARTDADSGHTRLRFTRSDGGLAAAP